MGIGVGGGVGGERGGAGCLLGSFSTSQCGGEVRGGEGRGAVGGVGEWNVHKAAPIYH